MKQHYIGIMSGTSVDAVDCVICNISDTIQIIKTLSTPFPESLRNKIKQIQQSPTTPMLTMAETDIELGIFFANCINQLLNNAKIEAHMIIAIGSHGQTVLHSPQTKHPFSLQIADPNHIAEITGITTIADFRQRDIAAGGEGAPLVSAFHHAYFYKPEENRVIVNIGGIANVTIIPKSGNTSGFDTGPGNTLMDHWIHQHLNKPMDTNGEWASSATPNQVLLSLMLDDDYFSRLPPKSTGFEYFNLNWLFKKLKPIKDELSPAEIQATLAELTAISIARAIDQFASNTDKVFVCGGGVFNTFLMKKLAKNLHSTPVLSTQFSGIDPQWVEAIAFAWLAKQTYENCQGNLPSVTGAKHPVILGGIYQGKYKQGDS